MPSSSVLADPPAATDSASHPPPASEAALPAAPRSLLRRVLQDRTALLREVVAGERHDLRQVALVSLLMVALGGLGLGVASAHAVQPLVAAVKLPLILLGALVVCGPAFYIAGVLGGSRLTASQALRIFAVGMGLRGAVVAALAPLLLFFAGVGSPYGFLLLLGLVVFGLGELGFLRTIERGIESLREVGDSFSLGLTRVWMVVYLAVVAQLTWTCRPLIGHPEEAWALLGGRGNIYSYLLQNVGQMF